MSKIVTIPTDGMNPFVVTHNGEKYVFTPGETVEVSDGVALEIEEYKRWREKYYGTIDPPYEGGGDIEELIVTANGTYTPPEGVDGYAPVTVNVVPPASDIDALIDGSLTEITSNAERVKDNAFYNNNDITHVNFPNALSIGNYAFYNTLVYGDVFTGNFPKVTDIKSYAFASSTTGADVHVLKEAFFPEVTKMDDYVFYKNTKLERIYFPKLKTISCYAFGTNQGQMILKSADFPEVTLIKSAAFAGCGWLTKLILRSETMCTLESTYAFNSCFHFHGTVNANSNPDGLKDGYIYVPRALIEDYKVATNWVTFADQFRALEDYTVDGTTTGELDESKVSL